MPLRDAGTWLSGGTPFTDEPRYWDGDIPWISAASLKDFHISRSDRCITELGARAGTRLVPPGTVLFVVRGMSLKTEFRVGITERQVAFGQDCKAILPAPGIDGKFLALAIKARSRWVLAMVDEAGHGTGRLPTDLISKLEIGVPEVPEQRQITEILDAVDEEIRKGELVLGKIIAKQTALSLNLLERMEATNTLVEALAGDPKNGIYKPASEYGPDGTRIVRIDSIQRGEIDSFASLLRVHVSAAEKIIFALENDDILINRVNSIDYVGKSAIVRHPVEPMVFESNIMRCRIRPDRAIPAYIALWLASPAALRHFRSSAKSAIAQASINQRDVKACPLALPNLSEQQILAARLDESRHEIEAHNAELSKLRLLKQGLMDDLLTGRVRVTMESVPGS